MQKINWKKNNNDNNNKSGKGKTKNKKKESNTYIKKTTFNAQEK